MRGIDVSRSTRSLAFLILFSAEAVHASGLKVTLATTPAETLPGVPVSVALAVSNLTARDVAISGWVMFTARSADGGSKRILIFLPQQYWRGEIGSSEEKYTVPAGGKIDLFMPVTEDFDSPLFADGRLNEPGQYDLVATVKGTSGTSGDSNAVHLRVATPTGEDEVVWKAIDGEVSGGAIRELCTGTIQRHRASRYYQLVAPFCVPFSSLDQYARDVLQGFPSLAGAYLDAARLAVGLKYYGAALNAYGQNRSVLAGTISAAGRPVAQDLMDHPGSTFGPVAGAWLRKHLASEAEWQSFYEKGHTVTTPVKVLPLVTCVVDNGDGTFSADFGFDNPNNYDVEVPIGVDNQLSPGAASQGQPVEFAPGAKESAFTIKGLTGVVKWTLQGKTVKASIAQSPKCSDVQPPEPQP